MKINYPVVRKNVLFNVLEDACFLAGVVFFHLQTILIAFKINF